MTQELQDYFKHLKEAQIKEFNEIEQKIQLFTQRHANRSITLLTSGGTSVPLEENTVRSIENFSTGTRGSLLAQFLLNNQVPVIFFYRQNSFLPFTRGISLNSLIMSKDGGKILNSIQQNLEKHKESLLLIPFKTVYFYLLGILKIKSLLPKLSIIILCSAVSDFIPKEVSKHKIQTTSTLTIDLVGSPKILGLMVSNDHLCISFKLQTDLQKVKERMCFALQKYQIDVVIGNLLNNKHFIQIQYNPKVFGEVQNQTYEGETEKTIVERVLNAHKLKFNLQSS